MNLHAHLAENIVAGLSGDVASVILGGFGHDGADMAPHSRQMLYALAYAVFRDFPGNQHYGSSRLWNAGLRMVDLVCEHQREDGTWQWRVPTTGMVWNSRYVWAVRTASTGRSPRDGGRTPNDPGDRS